MPDLTLPEIDFCVLDTETSGGRAVDDRVIEVAAFHYRDGIILDRFHSLINPGRPIPSWITDLTGIDDAMVASAPRFEAIADPLRIFLDRGVFVAHNAGFDYGFLQREFARMGQVWNRPRLCTVKLARQLLPELPSRSLGFLCDQLLIEIENRHRAAGDAEATVYVLKDLLRRLKKDFGIDTWEGLEAFASLGALRLPSGISFTEIWRLPAKPGRYSLRDTAGELLAGGNSKDVRRRVAHLFRSSNRSEKSERLRAAVRFLEVEMVDVSPIGGGTRRSLSPSGRGAERGLR